MSKPLLQIALDQSSLAEALEVAAVAAPHVDIIEAGTILCLSEGKAAGDTRSTSSSPITKPPMPVQHLPTSPLPQVLTGSP